MNDFEVDKEAPSMLPATAVKVAPTTFDNLLMLVTFAMYPSQKNHLRKRVEKALTDKRITSGEYEQLISQLNNG